MAKRVIRRVSWWIVTVALVLVSFVIGGIGASRGRVETKAIYGDVESVSIRKVCIKPKDEELVCAQPRLDPDDPLPTVGDYCLGIFMRLPLDSYDYPPHVDVWTALVKYQRP